MKKFSIFSLAAVIILFSACQKEPDPFVSNVSDKVISYTEDVTSVSGGYHSVTTYNISYDANNRVVSIVSATNNGDKFLLAYPAANKYTLDLYNMNTLSIHEDFFLTSDSFLDSAFQYNDTQDSSTEKYFYNSNKQLIKMNEYDYSIVSGSILNNSTSYVYNNEGDLITTTDSFKNIDTYEYFSNLSYALPVIIGPPNSTANKKSHLVKKHTLTSNGSFVGSADFTYTFDSSDRISTEKALINDGSIVIKTYQY
ncbi:MAG: hypothetical protein ABIN67_19805 [Ferruginibacter sp.]